MKLTEENDPRQELALEALKHGSAVESGEFDVKNRLSHLFAPELPPLSRETKKKLMIALEGGNPFGQMVSMQEGAPTEPRSYVKALEDWRGLALKGLKMNWEEELWSIGETEHRMTALMTTDKDIQQVHARAEGALRFIAGMRDWEKGSMTEEQGRVLWRYTQDWVVMRDLALVLRRG